MSDSETWFDPDESTWVCHPTEHPIPRDAKLVKSGREAFTGTSNDFFTHFIAMDYTRKFESTNDPFYAIELLRICHGSKVYPPVSVLEWLDSALNKYAESDGKEDLVKLLSLNGSRGVSRTYSKHVIQDSAKDRAQIVHSLVVTFGITPEEAAFMLWARSKESEKETPGSDWIAEDYKKSWRKQFIAKGVDYSFDEDLVPKILRSFPDWCLPEKIKRRYLSRG